MAMVNVHRSRALVTASVIILLAGIWAIISGYSLGRGTAGAEWSGLVVGILMIICSWGRLSDPMGRNWSVANVIWSIWLIISPWTFAAATGSLKWSNDVTGVIALICAIVALGQRPIAQQLPKIDYGPTSRAA